MAENVGQASSLPSGRQAGSLPHVGHALCVVCLVCLLPSVAWGRSRQVSESYGDILIVADPEPEAAGTHGYVEYAFTVSNKSERSHKVTLTLPAEQHHAYLDHIRAISRSVEVAPKSSVRVSLYVPSSPGTSGNNVAVRIDDAPQNRTLELRLREDMDRFSGSRGRHRAFGEEPPDPDLDEFWRSSALVLDLSPERVDPEKEGDRLRALAAELETTKAPGQTLPTNWLGYSRYDGIIIAAKDLGKLTPPALVALWQYVECGGSLVVLGKGAVPETWRPERDDRERYTLYRPGFGKCVVADDPDPRRWSKDLLRLVGRSWNQTAVPWRQNRSALEANRIFPVVADIGIPVRGLFVLMVCFGIIIGPVNLALLTRWKRRIWMLWTVPVLSGLTCAAVLGYMVLVEGWSGHVRTEAVTILDQASGRAATVGWTGFYSPVTPGDGLRFDHDTELALQGSIERYYEYERSGGKTFVVDWTDGQHLSQGWVTARVPTHFMLRKAQIRRERVTWAESGDGTITITNGLGVPIRQFWLADGRGRIHTGGPVEAGATATLTATRDDVSRGSARGLLRELYGGDWLATGRQLRSNPGRYLAPWTYLADVEGAPFVEDGLTGAKKENSHSVVVGFLRGTGQ